MSIELRPLFFPLDLIEQFHLPPIASAVEADNVQAGPTSTPNGP
jgi:hypothetical protein